MGSERKLVVSTDSGVFITPAALREIYPDVKRVEVHSFMGLVRRNIMQMRQAGIEVDGIHGPLGWPLGGKRRPAGDEIIVHGFNLALGSSRRTIETAAAHDVERVVVHVAEAMFGFSEITRALKGNEVQLGVENDAVPEAGIQAAAAQAYAINQLFGGPRAHPVFDCGHFALSQGISDVDIAILRFCDEVKKFPAQK